MSENIKQLFNEISPTYDKLNHLLSFNIDTLWRKKTIKRIQFDRQKPLKALDLCAGTLDLSLMFLKQFPQAHLTALDFSQAMLDIGQKKIPDSYQNRIDIVCGDALNLPFENNSFDVIFCGYGFRNLDDKPKGLKEIYRVLKPQGQILILDFFKPQSAITRLFHQTYGAYLLPCVGKIVSKNGDAYQYLHDSISDFYSIAECRDELTKQNFTHIKDKKFLMGISSLISGVKN